MSEKETKDTTTQEKEMKEFTKKSEKPAPAPTAWKRFLAKKWAFPAMYVAAAAIILTLMWVYQDSGSNDLVSDDPHLVVEQQGPEDLNPDALPVTTMPELMQWPVNDFSAVDVIVPFYDVNASPEVKQAALIDYNGTFSTHVGVSLASPENSAFEVVAAMSGTVILAEYNPLVGHQVEIEHDNGLVTVYQSLDQVQVTRGDQVQKGDPIAVAGRNELEKDLGVHLHFEIRQDGVPLNPEQYILEQ